MGVIIVQLTLTSKGKNIAATELTAKVRFDQHTVISFQFLQSADGKTVCVLSDIAKPDECFAVRFGPGFRKDGYKVEGLNEAQKARAEHEPSVWEKLRGTQKQYLADVGAGEMTALQVWLQSLQQRPINSDGTVAGTHQEYHQFVPPNIFQHTCGGR
jgi:hypothetical protein